MSKIIKGKALQGPVPLYTKIGWGVAWLLMLVMLAMILRNCATSIYYGSTTDPQKVEVYYQLGMVDGTAGKGPALRDEAVGNPVLRKSYSKGYRDGVDKGRMSQGDH